MWQFHFVRYKQESIIKLSGESKGATSFWENLANLYVGAPPGSWRPLLGEILDLPLKLIIALKRSLGQGNIFTNVCHSVNRGRGVLPLEAGDSAFRGRGVCIQGGSAQGGLYPGGI